MAGHDMPAVCVASPQNYSNMPLWNLETGCTITGKQTYWEVLLTPQVSDDLWCILKSASIADSCPSHSPQMAADFLHAMPWSLAVSCLLPCHALLLTSGSRVSCNLLSLYCSLGSHASHCQMWPQVVAIKSLLTFGVWIQEYLVPVSCHKPTFLCARIHQPSFHWSTHSHSYVVASGKGEGNLTHCWIVLRWFMQKTVNDQTVSSRAVRICSPPLTEPILPHYPLSYLLLKIWTLEFGKKNQNKHSGYLPELTQKECRRGRDDLEQILW